MDSGEELGGRKHPVAAHRVEDARDGQLGRERVGYADGTATDYPDAMREACREAAYLLAGEWGLSLEDAFILLSIRADVGVAQACKPSPFATIARVVMPKLDAIPGPFRF